MGNSYQMRVFLPITQIVQIVVQQVNTNAHKPYPQYLVRQRWRLFRKQQYRQEKAQKDTNNKKTTHNPLNKFTITENVRPLK